MDSLEPAVKDKKLAHPASQSKLTKKGHASPWLSARGRTVASRSNVVVKLLWKNRSTALKEREHVAPVAGHEEPLIVMKGRHVAIRLRNLLPPTKSMRGRSALVPTESLVVPVARMSLVSRHHSKCVRLVLPHEHGTTCTRNATSPLAAA